jgi:hypothetical protein
VPDSRKRLADVAFVLALMLYVLYGTSQVPPHADEYMHIATARDFFLLREQGAAALAFTPPVESGHAAISALAQRHAAQKSGWDAMGS